MRATATAHGALRLVAYVVPKAGVAVDAAALRQHVAALLPDYMVPSAFVLLERLPLTPNGKLDRRALPAPVVTANATRRLPRTPQEEVLCGLFAETLGLAEVGIDDNFFALGGDSIMSIQLVSRARRAGLAITPRAVFQHQTVASLAAVAGALDERDGRSGARPRGRRPAGDADHALAGRARRLDRPLQPGDAADGAGGADAGASGRRAAGRARPSRRAAAAARCGVPENAARRRTVTIPRTTLRLPRAGVSTRARHAARSRRHGLPAPGRRSRGSTTRPGRQMIADGGASGGRAAVARGRHDAAGGVVRCRPGRVGPAAAGDPPPGGRRRVVAHPAARPRGRLRRRRCAAPPSRCPRPAPRSGAGRRRSATNAHSPARMAELPLWTAMTEAPALSLTDGALDPARDLTGSARELTLTLPPAVTGALLTRVAAAFHAGVNDVLLTALALAVADWCRRHGRGADAPAVLVDVEGHGREEHALGTAPRASTCRARSAGSPASTRCGSTWARSISTMRWRAATPWARRSRASRSSCGRCPTTASATGCCATSTRRPPRRSPLGRRRRSASTIWDGSRRPAAPTCGWTARPRPWGSGGGDPEPRSGACGRGQCGDARRRRRAAACRRPGPGRRRCCPTRWCATWRRAGSGRSARSCTHAAQPGAGGRTPGDLPLVALTQHEIEEIERHYPRIDDILPLAPLQEGLLFHALYDAQAPDVYTIQLELALEGPLDADALTLAATRLIDASCQSARRLPAGRPRPPRAGDRAGGSAALDPHRSHHAARDGERDAPAGRDRIGRARRALRPRHAAIAAPGAGPPRRRTSTGSSSPAITS